METSQLSKEQLKLKDAFCEVRKAHRLIYEYQRRMQDLSWFIKNKLGFLEYKGWKFFTDTISPKHNIEYDESSWDWIYTYVFDYFLGYKTLTDNRTMGLGIIQITDTGYFKAKKENTNASQTDLSTYSPEKESDSVLMFYLLIGKEPGECWKEEAMIEEYATKNGFCKEEIDKHTHCIYTVPLYRFENEEATMAVLREFVNACKTKANVELEIME